MDVTQGTQPLPASDATQGAVQPVSAGVDPSLAPYLAEPANNTPTASQGDVNAQAPAQTTTVSPEDLRHIQSIADKRLAENYQLQQRLDMLQQQMAQSQQPQQPQNPYDPNTNWAGWISWENDRSADRAAAIS